MLGDNTNFKIKIPYSLEYLDQAADVRKIKFCVAAYIKKETKFSPTILVDKNYIIFSL